MVYLLFLLGKKAPFWQLSPDKYKLSGCENVIVLAVGNVILV